MTLISRLFLGITITNIIMISLISVFPLLSPINTKFYSTSMDIDSIRIINITDVNCELKITNNFGYISDFQYIIYYCKMNNYTTIRISHSIIKNQNSKIVECHFQLYEFNFLLGIIIVPEGNEHITEMTQYIEGE